MPHNYKKPEARNIIEWLREPLSGIIKPKELPTRTIKKAAKLLTMDTDLALEVGTAGWVPSGTAPLRLTYLNLSTSFERIDFAFADRDGTFDVYIVGTSVGDSGGNGRGARGQQITFQGAADAPIHTVLGTMNIYNSSGSQSAGTHIIAWEGIQ